MSRVRGSECFHDGLVWGEQMVPHVLKHAFACKAQVTLIVPLWRSAPYWPLCCWDGISLGGFVENWYDLPLYDSLYITCKSGECTIPCTFLVNLHGELYFLRVDGVGTEIELWSAFLPGKHIEGCVQPSHVSTLIAQYRNSHFFVLKIFVQKMFT